MQLKAIKLSKGFRRRIEGRFSKYEFEVGVLNDGPHYRPQDSGALSQYGIGNLKTLAGGPARKQTREPSGLSIADVSEENRKHLGFNYIRAAFRNRYSADLLKFSDTFFKLAFGRGQIKRAENLLQAIVRNPITRGDYGVNTRATADIKGFDRLMIDTGQLFKALKARIKRRTRV